jgi:hypothetical protein
VAQGYSTDFRLRTLASDAAADGQVLAVAEAVAIRAGRELTRLALETALRRQADPAEKKIA